MEAQSSAHRRGMGVRTVNCCRCKHTVSSNSGVPSSHPPDPLGAVPRPPAHLGSRAPRPPPRRAQTCTGPLSQGPALSRPCCHLSPGPCVSEAIACICIKRLLQTVGHPSCHRRMRNREGAAWELGGVIFFMQGCKAVDLLPCGHANFLPCGHACVRLVSSPVTMQCHWRRRRYTVLYRF